MPCMNLPPPDHDLLDWPKRQIIGDRGLLSTKAVPPEVPEVPPPPPKVCARRPLTRTDSGQEAENNGNGLHHGVN